MRVLRHIFSRFYAYVLWFFFAFLICGLVFSRLGDADAAHKVTLFADVPSMRDVELAAALEEELPEGVRMIKVHPTFTSSLRAMSRITPKAFVPLPARPSIRRAAASAAASCGASASGTPRRARGSPRTISTTRTKTAGCFSTKTRSISAR